MEEMIISVMTKKELYEKQMELLKLYLDKNAITKEQYEKSSKDLTEKMGIYDINKD